MTETPAGIPWDDVESAARGMFNIWAGGNELEWAQECWGHFAAQGMNDDSDLWAITRAYLRLLTLGRIYHQFCAFKWDEHTDVSLTDLAEDLEIHGIALGVIAASSARDLIAQSFADPDELHEAALLAVTNSMRQEVFGCLAKAYGGDSGLYLRICRTSSSAEEESDVCEEDRDADEFETTNHNCRAFEYVRNGFQD